MAPESAIAESAPPRAGIIGLGIIGGGVAVSLVRSGQVPAVFDVREDASNALTGVPPQSTSPVDVARVSDVVLVAVVTAGRAIQLLAADYPEHIDPTPGRWVGSKAGFSGRYKHVEIHKFLLAGRIDPYDLKTDETKPWRRLTLRWSSRRIRTSSHESSWLLSSRRISPLLPSTSIRAPGGSRCVAACTSTTQGKPNSRATTAACDIGPPSSVTTAAA